MLEVSVVITGELMDVLEDLFCEEIQEHWLLFQKDRHSPHLLKGYFDSEATFYKLFAELSERVPELKGREPEFSILEDQDWKMAYRHHLKPWKYGHLNWVPEWERETFVTQPDDVYLYLDSGMAFGTGSHETTRLCAEAIYDFWKQHAELAPQHVVIDAGCGSGILAMSAALLGYREVYAFDRDPEAAKVTLENCEKNGMDTLIEVKEAGLEQGLKGRRADLFVANIQADVLMIYVDNIVKAWNPQGLMILSGVLANEREKVTERFMDELEVTYPGQTFASSWDQKGDWVSILFRKA